MLWYFAAVALHVLAILVWVGVMSYWALVLQPARTRVGCSIINGTAVEPLGAQLAAIGWLCFAVALVTGGFLLYGQGVSSHEVTSGWIFHGRFGEVLRVKLVLVSLLLLLQLFIRRRSAIIRWLFLIVGLAAVGISTLLIR